MFVIDYIMHHLSLIYTYLYIYIYIYIVFHFFLTPLHKIVRMRLFAGDAIREEKDNAAHGPENKQTIVLTLL